MIAAFRIPDTGSFNTAWMWFGLNGLLYISILRLVLINIKLKVKVISISTPPEIPKIIGISTSVSPTTNAMAIVHLSQSTIKLHRDYL